jgi:hypothetical protein
MFQLVNRFIDHLQVLTKNKWNTIADKSLNLFSLAFYGNSSQQCLFLCNILTIRFLAKDFNTETTTVPTELHTPDITVLQHM